MYTVCTILQYLKSVVPIITIHNYDTLQKEKKSFDIFSKIFNTDFGDEVGNTSYAIFYFVYLTICPNTD